MKKFDQAVKTKLQLVVWLVILLIGNACGLQPQVQPDTPEAEITCPEPGEGLKLLKHAAQGYCLLYPTDYVVVETSDTMTDLVLGSITNHIDLRVSLTVEDAAGRTLEQVADQVAADFTIPGLESERTATTLAGEAAVVFNQAEQPLRSFVLAGSGITTAGVVLMFIYMSNNL